MRRLLHAFAAWRRSKLPGCKTPSWKVGAQRSRTTHQSSESEREGEAHVSGVGVADERPLSESCREKIISCLVSPDPRPGPGDLNEGVVFARYPNVDGSRSRNNAVGACNLMLCGLL